ncbi:MAG: GIY-YIG nuclease family protein [Methanomassiliicoccales archaeon]|nr:GIY-YIG nuclease family protein [Methanomassiliicoccales archaeon]
MSSNPGVYVLVMHLNAPTDADVGKLGRMNLMPGYYLYCGSAQAGLGPRLARHMRKDKVSHWHIDHLTLLAEPIGALLFFAGTEGECVLARELSDCPFVSSPGKGFGSSDCDCPTHLFQVHEGVPLIMVMDMIRSVGLKGTSERG